MKRSRRWLAAMAVVVALAAVARHGTRAPAARPAMTARPQLDVVDRPAAAPSPRPACGCAEPADRVDPQPEETLLARLRRVAERPDVDEAHRREIRALIETIELTRVEGKEER